MYILNNTCVKYNKAIACRLLKVFRIIWIKHTNSNSNRVENVCRCSNICVINISHYSYYVSIENRFFSTRLLYERHLFTYTICVFSFLTIFFVWSFIAHNKLVFVKYFFALFIYFTQQIPKDRSLNE